MTGLALQPGQSDLPSKHSTHSYWHQDPSPILLGHRTTPQLPTHASVVVVGSGITGAFAARELVQAGTDVVMLEAREACWGATGRNGGHCQPLAFLSELDIAKFELDTYRFLSDLIRENNIPCSWEEVGGVYAISSPATVPLIEKRIAHLRVSEPEIGSHVRLVTDQQELRSLRLRDDSAVAAVVQDRAAKCWPYKLVCWVLERLLEHPGGLLNLQTGTPVEHVQHHGQGWIVHTERGQVAADSVILATNAYTSRLLPRFTGIIIPTRGQVSALIPPANAPPLAHSHLWSVREDGDYGESENYLVQRPTGELILGGERMCTSDAGNGVSHDDEIDETVAKRLRRAIRSELRLDQSSPDSDPDELAASYEWTGIMGFSRDSKPWVGRVPASLGGSDESSSGGLWLSAGYTGHGMPVAARTGISVAQKILGKTGQGVVEVPPDWLVSEERVDKAQTLVMPETMEDELRVLVQNEA
ncbi:Glycine/D-amino acid oxidase (deaminating) [Geosmithia morbida]|uniref:Glycine/D-amino acid oxidase (Deaminating) n=1 Tax=Geosmithia morbida TaxID=1094350 RepID=A0A9P5D612_9HYPO|nr:Glycine/D-amino acid oxidase (deaminating) [Geosmithia morbida]KAF4124325.1 Glycine/D-amino acid oxidase (deaminating) [Geosmithia morbida]